MLHLPDKPDRPLDSDQRDAWDRMRMLLMRTEDVDKHYNLLPDSRNGRIISTDIARFLDERYASFPKGVLRDIAPGDDLAWRYAHDRLEREIQNRGKRRFIRFMAGGWGAGKTHALSRDKDTIPDLSWDGTLKDFIWAVTMIDRALARGWKVEVAYVYRDIELAFYGAISRAKDEGRLVPLEQIPMVHRAAQQSILKLSLYYFVENRVSFKLLHNLGTSEVSVDPLSISRKDLDKAGALHYLESHEVYHRETAKHLERASEVYSGASGGYAQKKT